MRADRIAEELITQIEDRTRGLREPEYDQVLHRLIDHCQALRAELDQEMALQATEDDDL